MATRYIESRKRVGLSLLRIRAIEGAARAILKQFPKCECDFPSGAEVVKWLDQKYQNTVSKNSLLKTLKAFASGL